MGIKQLGRGTRIALAGGVLCVVVVGGLALAIDTPAEAMLGEIDAIQVPEIPAEAKRNPQLVQRISAIRQASLERRAFLIGELYRLDPDYPQLATLLPERWQGLLGTDKAPDAMREISRSLAHSKSKPLQDEAAFWKVVGQFREASKTGTTEGLETAVGEFTRQHPRDERGAEMLDALAKAIKDPVAKASVMDKLIATYPKHPLTQMTVSEKRRLEGVGKPFELKFADAIHGQPIDSAALKGKIVVVDFWATWCGPCLATMPQMKSLYARYKDQGVEFIGISQDVPRSEGGFDKLKQYVASNEIEWPQYYEGTPSGSEFAVQWGVTTIPAVFVVDADGKLVSTQAGQHLETLIPELLAKRQSQPTP